MLISTKGRYALRVLIDLAEQDRQAYVPMRDVAQRQGISLKYLERIIPVLTKHGIIEGLQGKGGGYRLVLPPEQCRLGDILRLTEGDLAPVACLENAARPCPRRADCQTYPLWAEFYQVVNTFFDNKTLSDLLPGSKTE